MPQVYICSRCAETIDNDTQDWVVVSIDNARTPGLESRVHATCEVKRLKDIQMKVAPGPISMTRGPRV